jgi:DNA-binding SARP family transcriptional activator
MVPNAPQRAQEAPVRTYVLRMLGPPSLDSDDGHTVPGLGPGKSLAMLAYLAVRRSARRDELISILWGEVPEAKARNAFRQSLHRLRSVLGEEILPMDRDQVAIADNGLLSSDRQSFLAACEAGRWDAAVALYRGEFLEGLQVEVQAFERWVDGERVRLRSRFQEALLAAGRQAAADGNVREALQYAERLTATTPYDEDAVLFEANTLVAAGRPGQAITALLQFAKRIDEELDLPVSPAIRTLIDRLERRKQARQSAASPERAPPNRQRSPTFVGRDAELSQMLAALERLRSGRGATIVVEGEAGMGKSRLLDEFFERAKNLGGVLLLRGREAALGSSVPYAAVAEALRPIVRASGVSGASRHLLAEAARLLPELRDSFELPTAPPVEDETGRLRFFEGIAAVIDAAAYERPVCLALDDVHHSSASTLDLITYLSRRLHESPVLLIVAYRPDRSGSQAVERLRGLVASGDQSSDLCVALGPLDHDDTRAIVKELLASAGHVADADVDRVADFSGGRPFAALELARGVIRGESPSAAPAPLRDILWARLQAASPAQRRVLFAASLFERSASLRLLAAAAHLHEAAAFEAADELTRAGLLRAAGDGFVIAHDCASNFLVESSGLAGRALLSSWAADALALEDDRTDAELATLFAMAGRGAEAFAHARAAAFDAAGVGASAEVMRLLNIALTFAPNEAARREIDALMVTFGRGRPALPGGDPSSTDDVMDDVTDDAVDDVDPDVFVEPLDAPAEKLPVRPRRVRDATARQWIGGVAISLLIVAAGIALRRGIDARRIAQTSPDTLLLVERDARGQNQLRALVGAFKKRLNPLVAAPAGALGPVWIDSVAAPFTSPLASPDRKRVALGRVTPHGQDLFVVSADRRDTVAIAVAANDNIALDWSPDSRALLFSRTRTLPDGSLDSDLLLARLDHTGRRAEIVAIDTSSSRAITEAKWSPSGMWIAWVARSGTGEARQRDVFVSHPDGSGIRNLTSDPVDDDAIDWSPDASLLAFTGARGGNTRLYVYDFDNARLWPVSEANGEDHATFSPDGRMIAFESSRDGDLAIYTRRALGGTPRRITPLGRQFSIAAWRGAPSSYLDRLRIVGGTSIAVGDTMHLSLLALSATGAPVRTPEAHWHLLDRSVLDGTDSSGDASDSIPFHVVGKSAGTARVIATIGGWRADTLTVVVSSTQPIHVEDDFSRPGIDSRWLSLGAPPPRVGPAPNSKTPALYPNGDLEWDSGVLLRTSFELREGLRVRARVFAPFSGNPSPATVTIGLVPVVAESDIDRLAPRLTPLIAVQWDGASGNLIYSVGHETSSEPATAFGPQENHQFEIAIAADRSISFSVDGRVRWTSSLTFLGNVGGPAVQLWIGGRATSTLAAVSSVQIDLSARAARP